MQYVFLIRSRAGGKKYVTEPSDVFLTTGARAYQKHVLHGPETVSIFIFHLDKNLANVYIYIYIQNAAEINSIPLAIQAKVRQAHGVSGNKIQSRSSDPSWRKTACAETCSGTSAANSTQI